MQSWWRCWLLAVLFVFLALLAAGQARAVDRSGRPYFIDFRAGLDSITGHTYIVYGRLDADGRVIFIRHADIFPEDENIGLVVGIFVPVRAETRVLDGDSRRHAVISYRRYLTAAEYARLAATVRREHIIDRRWSVLLFNCNDFVNNVAQALGLRTPSSLLVPHVYVSALRLLNGRQD